MRRKAFALTILSLFVMSLLLALPPKSLSSPKELKNLAQNQKLLIQGQVIKETISINTKTFYLNNSFKINCPLPCPSFLYKNVSALVTLENYDNKINLNLLEIKQS